MTKEILALAPLPEAQMKKLEESFTVHRLWKAQDPEALLQEIKDRVQGMVSVYNRPVSGRLIRALSGLEIIAHYGAGYDVIDMDAVRERDIVVTHTPDTVTGDTADMAMALVLAVMRRIVEGDMVVRSGKWGQGKRVLGRCLAGKTLGIVGLGRIGRAVAIRAQAFGMKVVYYGPREKKGVDYPFYSSLLNMAGIADVLVLTCLYDRDTHHLVNARVFKEMKQDAIVVNVARGSVICEPDLIDALESGTIGGAGLDVFENEPDVPAALCRLDNVVLQPHHAGGTVESRVAMAETVVDNLLSYFEKGEVLTPV